MGGSRTAVFTGAGLSTASPASLPQGYELRDAVLDVMYDAAHRYVPSLVRNEHREAMRQPAHKLEQVLGRLWRIVGSDALDCLKCLSVEVPNESHMLCALHLARGGTQVTVNLDPGIEVAFALIIGERQLPENMRATFGAPLEEWRAATDADHRLRVVATRAEFDDWAAHTTSPVLLKVHGSLSVDGRSLHDVVVEDSEELGGLHGSRLTAIEHLARADRVLVTGYGGLDPDVYGPTLVAVSQTDAVWATRGLSEHSPVRADCDDHGVTLIVGDPDGLASTRLRDLLDEHDLQWPAATADAESWTTRFAAWRRRLEARYDDFELTLAWSWLLADSGHRDEAIEILRRLVGDRRADHVRIRLADALYDRASRSDRLIAAGHYMRVAANPWAQWHSRAHASLRVGGIARGVAIRGGWWRMPLIGVTFASAGAVLIEQQHLHRDDTESAAHAHAVLGQTTLRMGERAAISCARGTWPIVARTLRWAARRCRVAAELTSNGNRRALTRSHSILADALAALLSGRDHEPGWRSELVTLGRAYEHAGDFAGAGNCYAALAVVAVADGDADEAFGLLDRARSFYGEGRADGEPIVSGEALLDRLRDLFGRFTV